MAVQWASRCVLGDNAILSFGEVDGTWTLLDDIPLSALGSLLLSVHALTLDDDLAALATDEGERFVRRVGTTWVSAGSSSTPTEGLAQSGSLVVGADPDDSSLFSSNGRGFLVVPSDCNANGRPDECDIAAGTSLDANDDGIPDECE